MYFYLKSIKSDSSDELVNTCLIRPAAGIIVWVLYYTSITPNQVTIVSLIAGISAAFFYLKGTPEAFIIAGLLITLKDLLDSADGQLARAKQQYSRIGRFLDSIVDFIVDSAVFAAIGWNLFESSNNWWMPVLALLGLAGISLRVSYHVFYQVNFLHLQNKYSVNRITEKIIEEDINKGGLELLLQRIFQFIYGWQDNLVARVDRWSYSAIKNQSVSYNKEYGSEKTVSISARYLSAWYSDRVALRISGFLGFGTELFLLMLCSVFNQLELYLYLNLFLMNGVLVICIFYRRMILLGKISCKS